MERRLAEAADVFKEDEESTVKLSGSPRENDWKTESQILQDVHSYFDSVAPPISNLREASAQLLDTVSKMYTTPGKTCKNEASLQTDSRLVQQLPVKRQPLANRSNSPNQAMKEYPCKSASLSLPNQCCNQSPASNETLSPSTTPGTATPPIAFRHSNWNRSNIPALRLHSSTDHESPARPVRLESATEYGVSSKPVLLGHSLQGDSANSSSIPEVKKLVASPAHCSSFASREPKKVVAQSERNISPPLQRMSPSVTTRIQRSNGGDVVSPHELVASGRGGSLTIQCCSVAALPEASQDSARTSRSFSPSHLPARHSISVHPQSVARAVHVPYLDVVKSVGKFGHLCPPPQVSRATRYHKCDTSRSPTGRMRSPARRIIASQI